ncbi:MAG TPA: DinB family protein [Burkholderiales bacterium]
MMALAESIERLEAMPEFLDTAVEVVSQQDLRWRPSPGQFSLVEHACHLRDLEREGYLVRVRRMIEEKMPALEPFDGTAVARERDYLSQDARLAAQQFAAARREVTGLLAPLTPADLARAATFEGKRVTFGELVAMMVEHDREHREEIEDLMDSIERR